MTYLAISPGDGLEVWRRVLEDTCQKTKAETLALENAVLQPKPCSTPEQVPMALERWFTTLQTYLDAGGEKLDEDRNKTSILKLLPWKIQEKVLWDVDDFKSCEQLVS